MLGSTILHVNVTLTDDASNTKCGQTTTNSHVIITIFLSVQCTSAQNIDMQEELCPKALGEAGREA